MAADQPAALSAAFIVGPDMGSERILSTRALLVAALVAPNLDDAVDVIAAGVARAARGGLSATGGLDVCRSLARHLVLKLGAYVQHLAVPVELLFAEEHFCRTVPFPGGSFLVEHLRQAVLRRRPARAQRDAGRVHAGPVGHAAVRQICEEETGRPQLEEDRNLNRLVICQQQLNGQNLDGG